MSLIISALNEAVAIGATLSELPWDLLSQCIVVDNGSTDATAEGARRNGARVVSEPLRGYGRACFAEVQASNPASQILAFIDGDGSDVSGDLPRLIQHVPSWALVSKVSDAQCCQFEGRPSSFRFARSPAT